MELHAPLTGNVILGTVQAIMMAMVHGVHQQRVVRTMV
jgi:hypothetical protein